MSKLRPLTVHLERFDWNSICVKDKNSLSGIRPFTCLIVAPKGSGKSFLIREIIASQRTHFFYALLLCPTEPVNHFFKTIVPAKNMEFEYDDNFIKNLFKRQYKLRNQGCARMDALLIADDIQDRYINFEKLPYTRQLFVNGRHYGISSIYTTQYLKTFSPFIREQQEIIIIGNITTDASLKGIFETCGSIFPNYAFFKKLVNQYTRNYNFLVIDTRMTVNNQSETHGDPNFNTSYDDEETQKIKALPKCVFWVRADMNTRTRLFNNSAWEENDEKYREKMKSYESILLNDSTTRIGKKDYIFNKPGSKKRKS